MKNVSISLTDQHASEIEAQVSSGDYASVSEVIRAALREFLSRAPHPSLEQIDRDIAAHRAASGSGAKLVDAASARWQLRNAVSE